MIRMSSLALALALSGAAATAIAATPIDETRPLDARGRLSVENVKGRIEVEAWDRAEVRIEGSLGKGVEKLEIDGDRNRLSVRVVYPKRNGWGWGKNQTEPTELKLRVPRLADLDVDGVSADIFVDGMASRELSIDSVSGDVSVAAAPRRASVESVSGDLALTLNSSKVDVESVSGDILLRGRLDGEVHAETVSGDFDLRVLETALRKMSGSSVSGDMRVATALAPQAEVSVETVSGDVTLVLPRNLSAEVRGETFSGDLRAPGAEVQRPKHGPGARFEHRYGNGGADIRIETFSGDGTLELD